MAAIEVLAPPTPTLRVGGCLASKWRAWRKAGAEPWTVKTLQKGYRLPFLQDLPPLVPVPKAFPSYRSDPVKARALSDEVEAMMEKGALEEAPPHTPGFYSRLFLVEKSTGGWRPVIDLSPLNHFVCQTKFSMETAASVLAAVRKGDFMASIDLSDAYFQVPIHPTSRKYLRFVHEGKTYQFRALCFGLATAPQVFTRIFSLISEWSHSRGIRLLRYIDDWLVLAKSAEEFQEAVNSILCLLYTSPSPRDGLLSRMPSSA